MVGDQELVSFLESLWLRTIFSDGWERLGSNTLPEEQREDLICPEILQAHPENEELGFLRTQFE